MPRLRVAFRARAPWAAPVRLRAAPEPWVGPARLAGPARPLEERALSAALALPAVRGPQPVARRAEQQEAARAALVEEELAVVELAVAVEEPAAAELNRSLRLTL